jgi:acetyl esterase/lipase
VNFTENERAISARASRWSVRIASLVVTSLAIACWTLGAATAVSDEPRIADDDIVVLRDLRYREAASKNCTLDLAMQKDYTGQPRPAILVVHGGGWVEGDKSSFATLKNRNPANIIEFARLGFVALGVNYRLSGEAPFPAALDDCRCAVRWLRAHAGEYRVDSLHIGVYGNSAGGHLALLMGMMPPPARGTSEPYADQSSLVQAVVSDSGPLDLLTQQRDNQLRSVIEKFMGGPPEGPRAAEYLRASPVNHISGKIPPLLLIYGEVDTQVNVNITDQFVAALSQSGHKDVSYVRLAGVDHCPHSLIGIPYLPTIVNEFFLRTLRPAKAEPKH